MSDDQEWKPPVFSGGPTDSPTPFVAPEGPSGTAAPLYGPPGGQSPAVQPPSAGSWTAPPKPGLIPLRPLTLGNILGASFQVLRRNPRPTFGFAMGVQSAIMLITLAVVGLVTFSTIARVASASVGDTEEVGAGAFFIILLSALIPGLLSMVMVALVQGVLMLEIQRATLGEKLKLRQLWARGRGRLAALLGWMFMVALAMLLGLVVLAGLVLLLTMLGSVGVALAVVVGIFGSLAGVALAMWLGTKVSLVPSVLMGERPSLRVAVARSWSLTNGYFWRTFGIQILVSAVLGVAVQIISVPIQLIAPMTIFLLDPNGTGGPVTIAVTLAVSLLSILVILVASAISLVVQSACTGLIYIDLRMRKEGLDLDLARYVEEANAGGQPADPYLLAHTRPAAYASPAGPSPAAASPGDSPWA